VFNSPLLPLGGSDPGCASLVPHTARLVVHRFGPLNPRRETNGHLRMDLVVPQPPPVTGGQHTPLGEDAAQFHRSGPQAVPPRGAAADESAGTCGADSPLPSGRVQRSNTEHPPTIVTDIPGASCCPPPGTQMSTPIPAIFLGSTGAFMRYSSLGI